MSLLKPPSVIEPPVPVYAFILQRVHEDRTWVLPAWCHVARWLKSRPKFEIKRQKRVIEACLAGDRPIADLEKETVRWCREMLQNSPMALRCLKAALNADCDGQAGLQELAGNATMLFYMTEEGQEGRNAFNQKRQPDFSKFKRNP